MADGATDGASGAGEPAAAQVAAEIPFQVRLCGGEERGGPMAMGGLGERVGGVGWVGKEKLEAFLCLQWVVC